MRQSRPFYLLGGLLLYALGAGLARYIGITLDWTAYWMGQGCVFMLQLSSQYLNEYFDALAERSNPRRRPLPAGENPDGLPRMTALVAAATTLTIGAILTYLLLRRGDLDNSSLLLLGVAFLMALAYAVPPLRLVNSGYGELTSSILAANLFPAFAFILQAGSLHRLLAMATFPLTFLYLAMLLAFSLPDYGSDLKTGKKSLMVRIGWQRGMFLHNLLLLFAYLILLGAVAQGFPWRLAWPGLLTFPLSLFQIYQMYRIAQGAPPRWSLLTFTAMATFALTAYFFTFAIWTG